MLNGIICLDILGIDLERLGRDISTCCLWNPASREFKIVAFPHVPDQVMLGDYRDVGFGFDPQSNDFKIVATTTVELDIVLSYMVYTLSTDSWKRIP